MDEQLILNEFPKFKELLIKNNFFEEQDLLDLLANCGPDKENQLTVIIANIELRDPTEIERFAQIMQPSGLAIEDTNRPSDETDSSLTNLKNQWMIRFKDLLSTPKTLGDSFTVKNATKIKSNKYGDVYSMTSRPRGFCVIIDNQLFAGTTLPFRTGSRADAYRLSDVFSQLHFDIKYFVNKTSHEMKNILQNVIAMSEQLVEHDALAVVILSHGIKDEIYGTDGKTIAVDTILEFFNNLNCPALINKPKMFFLSACRGSQIDTGIMMPLGQKASSPFGASLGVRPNHVPTWSDIFVYYSTIEGYASLRNTNTGSWFGYELANSLAEFAHREHLHDLITIKVAERLHERISQMNGNSVKQAIETQTKGFVKKVYFNPGLYLVEKN